jgi:phosphate transport system substrate-binding protein
MELVKYLILKLWKKAAKQLGSYDLFLKQNDGDKKKAISACSKVRTDGVSIDIDGDYTETLNRLDANPEAIGCIWS